MEDKTKAVIRELDDGLVMRSSTTGDADRLAEFNGRIHGEDPFDTRGVEVWTRDLLLKEHPTFRKGDFVIIEKAATGEIVSATNLISQTWMYEGIPFRVGRPELVGTLPEYRNRGLIRALFEEVHRMSEQRGELVQAITGIEYFYRQFGYEMTVDLGGGRSGLPGALPKLEEGQQEPFVIRAAGEADIPFLLRMMERENRRWMLTCRRDAADLRHEMLEKSRENINRIELHIIETPQGEAVGYLGHPWFVWWGDKTGLTLTRYELDEGRSFLDVTPTVLRYLWSKGQEYAAAQSRTADVVNVSLGCGHPIYKAAGEKLSIERKPYAYYMRVADLPAFLRLIGPALEKRLQASDFAGHSGALNLSFYRGGVRMVLEQGRLAAFENWKPEDKDVSAAFPGLTFLHMLFGHRTVDEIRNIYIDCWVKDEARALLEVLFPKRCSSVWALS